MAEREPTVIERMIGAFWDDIILPGEPTWQEIASIQTDEHGRSITGKYERAMLAAVRELYAVSVAPGSDQGTLMTQNWLSDRIKDHEPRSEGEG